MGMRGLTVPMNTVLDTAAGVLLALLVAAVGVISFIIAVQANSQRGDNTVALIVFGITIIGTIAFVIWRV